MRILTAVNPRRMTRLLLGVSLILTVLTLLSASRIRTTTAASAGQQDAPQSTLANFPADAPSLGAIPDSPAGGTICGDYASAPKDVSFTVSGLANAAPTNVAVSFSVTHSWVGDLIVTLRAPGGTPSKIIFAQTTAAAATDCGDDSDLIGPYNFLDTAPATPTFWNAAVTANATTAVAAGSYRATTPGGGAGGGVVTTITSAFTGVTNPNGTWTLRFHDGGAGDTGSVTAATLTIDSSPPPAGKHLDFDGDGKADFAVFRPSNNGWFILQSATSTFRSVTWGTAGDVLVQGHYDADNKLDIAVFRPSSGSWYIQRSTDGTLWGVQFGINGDIPVPADYDNDQKADVAVYRPSNSTWYILKSSDGSVITQQFGINGDLPVPADYNGDGSANIAVFRPSTGFWYTSVDPGINYGAFQWGQNGDRPVPGDYDGDGKTDIAVFRPQNGVWYIVQSSNGVVRAQPWGVATDKVVQADYDGDGKTDIAIWRPSTAVYWTLESLGGRPSNGKPAPDGNPDLFNRSVQWGTSGDTAVAYVPEHFL